MNLKNISIWAFCLAILCYLICIVNAIISITTVMPLMPQLMQERITDPREVQGYLQHTRGEWLVISTIITWFGIATGIVSLILSIVAIRGGKGEKFPGKGMAIAAMILSIAYVSLALLGMLMGLFFGSMFSGLSGGSIRV